MRRRLITTSVRSSRVERVVHSSTAKVVVLIPPPVPPGLAPININRISRNKPAWEMVSSESGTDTKPAVRAEIT